MKINFDNLFQEDPPVSLDSAIINFALPTRDSLNKNNLSTSVQTQDATPITHRHTYSEDQQSVRRVLEFKLALALQQEVQMEPKRAPIIQLKKTKKVDIAKLTNKMHRNPACSKKECIALQRQKQLKDKEQAQPLPSYKPPRKYTQRQEEEQHTDGYEIYERLYHQAKILQLQKEQLAKMYQTQRKKEETGWKKAGRPNKYMENYVPFYERLDWEVKKSQQKYKIYEQCPELIQGTTKKYFTPTLISTKYQDIESRYSKDVSSRETLSYRHQLASSLNTSMMSVMSLDKSTEIVTNVEEFFFQKMKFIFIDQGERYVSVHSNQIQLLSSVEFRIMQEFIRDVEQSQVTVEQFEDKMRAFYNSLGFSEKQQLRTHLRKARKVPRKQQLSKKMTESCIKIKTSCKNHRANSYYSKMQAYV